MRLLTGKPPRLLLCPFCSHFQAWCRVVKASWAKHPAFQDDLSRRIPRATFASEAPAATAQPWELRVAQASCWRSREQRCQADRQLRRTWAQQAFVARRVAPGLCRTARRQAGESSRAQAFCWMLWARESCQHQVIRDHAVPTLSARVQETWTQSATQGHVQRTAVTHFQQAGPRRFLRTHWAQWQTALFRVWLEPQAEVQKASRAHPARPRASLRRWPGMATRGRLLVLMNPPALKSQTCSCRPWAMGPSPTQHRSPSGRMRGEASWAQSDSQPPLCPTSQLQLQGPRCACWTSGQRPPGAGGDCSSETRDLEGKTRHLGRKYLQCWRLEARLRRLQSSQQASLQAAMWQRWVDVQGAERLVRTLLRQRHLRWAWRLWRWRVLRLQVAQRLQSQEDGRVLSQAFKKWHQCLAARALRTRASSSMRPWSKAGLRRPGSRLETARAPALGGPGAEKGAQLQL